VIEEGTPAPDLELRTDAGDTLRLSELRGKPVVLFFYPKDETRGCTAQACGMRDAYPDLEGRAHVFGVSTDDAESHRSFRANHALPFPLLLDDDNRLADAFGIARYDTDAGIFYRRQTVVLGADGAVARTMDEVDPLTHADAVLAAVGG
jgi:peroxiredoxin Q/BCP